MLCAVIKGPDIQKALEQIEKIQLQCSLIELRLDLFSNWNVEELKYLQRIVSMPMIFTLRSKSQGGAFEGNEDSWLLKIRELIQLKPEYLDLENTVPNEFIQKCKEVSPETKIILSYHNFKIKPELKPILDEMQQKQADIYKIAVMVHSSCEALELLHFMKSHKHVLAMGMGEFGKITRILSPLFGGKFVYASIDETAKTAPGQLTVNELLNVYHYQDLKPTTGIYGLIGNPIDKSLGHIAHNAVMHLKKLSSVYVKFPVEHHQLSELMSWKYKLGIKGLSVTIPLKEEVLSHLEHIDPWASQVRAVNTIVSENGGYKGYNTDGKAALDAIEEKMPVQGKKILILGAGGASKAIIAEAQARGAEVVVLNRDELRAKKLGESMNCAWGDLNQMPIQFQQGYDILINATSVEMPIESQWILKGCAVMDIQLQPKLTSFLLKARQKGCTLIFGYEMWINQALAQYKLWFQDQDASGEVKDTMTKMILQNIQ